MSEQGNFDFSKNNDPELAAITYEFTNEQYQYYSWLDMNVSDDMPVLLFNHESSARLRRLSSKFAVCAHGVNQYFENTQMSANLIGLLWYEDEMQRTHKFSELSGGLTFGPLDKSDVVFAVESLLQQYRLDPEMFVLMVREEYKKSVKADVERLLINQHLIQEATLLKQIPILPLSTPESVHVGQAAKYFKDQQSKVATKILGLIVDSGPITL